MTAAVHASSFHHRAFRTRGFSMIELLITVALVAILTALALPSFRELLIGMNVTTLTNDLVAALNTAKVEAVKRGLPVAVVSNSNGSEWTSGWKIKADTARDGSYATTLAEHDAVKATYSVFAKATGSGGNDSRAAFSPVGTLQSATAFDFSVCRPVVNAKITESRRINVGGGGTISSRRDVTGSPAGTCN